jgi:hypothetical protein
MKISILNIDYHRNGIGGAPFHAIVFRDRSDSDDAKIGVVFEQPWHTAVLDIAKLVDSDVEFGSNSYRGDQYEPLLRKAIAQFQREEQSNA